MSIRVNVERAIIENVKVSNLPYNDKVVLAVNLFKDIVESLEWLDFDDADDLEELHIFKKQCDLDLL